MAEGEGNGDVDLVQAYAAGEIDGEEYLEEIRRRAAEDAPATKA